MQQFGETDAPPESLRQAYLDGLAEPQELYLEHLVATGRTWRCDEIAYVVVNNGQLVEFFVAPDYARQITTFFNEAIDTTGATQVLCKSFDTQLLFAALSRPAMVTSIGLLFRRIAEPSFEPQPALTFRSATPEDIATIARLDGGFFDGTEEIQNYADVDGLDILTSNGEIVGCGIATPVIEGRTAIDVGMWVAPNHRGRGYGTHIIAYLKDRCLQRGLRPICGCDATNLASYRALNAAGFVSEHRLLQIIRQS